MQRWNDFSEACLFEDMFCSLSWTLWLLLDAA